MLAQPHLRPDSGLPKTPDATHLHLHLGLRPRLHQGIPTCYSRLDEFTEVVDEGQTEGGPQIVKELDLKTVIAEAVDWNWSRKRMDRTLQLDALAWAVALIIWLGRIMQVFKMKRDTNRLALYIWKFLGVVLGSQWRRIEESGITLCALFFRNLPFVSAHWLYTQHRKHIPYSHSHAQSLVSISHSALSTS